MRVSILGAGVAGLCAAHVLSARGMDVVLCDDGRAGASTLAGGMIAPWCEAEVAALVLERGKTALDWWAARVPGVERRGTLVLATGRDQGELTRFAARTLGHQSIAAGDLEPALADRFDQALFFADEGHLDPAKAFAHLRQGLPVAQNPRQGDVIVDCRGIAARDQLPLRAVRGEMLVLHAPDITLSRPIRLLHPRWPLYVVPRGDGVFMLGATMLESDDPGPVTARSVVDLLNAAYALHPGFAEARVLKTGAGLRPAFADNLPRVERQGGVWHLNGLYRHGFLLAPALAEELADALVGGMAHAD
jgi:glycine oxidase